MEPLWSPVVATGGNQWQTRHGRKGWKQAKSVATGCHRLPENIHGKEGVDGSSPSEGSAKAPEIGAFSFAPNLHDYQRAAGMKPYMEPSGPRRSSEPRETVGLAALNRRVIAKNAPAR
jgi:hypothetical protein